MADNGPVDGSHPDDDRAEGSEEASDAIGIEDNAEPVVVARWSGREVSSGSMAREIRTERLELRSDGSMEFFQEYEVEHAWTDDMIFTRYYHRGRWEIVDGSYICTIDEMTTRTVNGRSDDTVTAAKRGRVEFAADLRLLCFSKKGWHAMTRDDVDEQAMPGG